MKLKDLRIKKGTDRKRFANGKMTMLRRGANGEQLTEEFLKTHPQEPVTSVQKGGNDIICSHSMSREGRLMPWALSWSLNALITMEPG